MPRLRIAVFVIAIVVGVAPAAARAAVTSTNITSWTSSQSGTPANSPYLISFDNQATTLAVGGTSNGTLGDRVDIACYFGANPQFKVLAANLPVGSDGTFATSASAPQLRPIAGHACRLRAVPSGHESTGDSNAFAGPQVAVAETALLPTISGGPNNGTAYNYYVGGLTFTASAAWKAAGTGGCGPFAAPISPAFDIGNFPIDCAGSLLADDLGTWGGRSEVQIDGRNAYDAASAQALFPRTGGHFNGSQDLAGFPKLTAGVNWDPSTGLISSRSTESWVSCHGLDPYKPSSIAVCPSFDDTGVRLERDITTGDGGRVITLTDTWSSMDGQSHSLDLLYDDYAGVFGNATGERGWQFPAQSGFTQYGTGSSLPAPTAGPGSILVHTNVTAPDGAANEGFGAITFARPPTGLRFASNSELEERNLLTVPAGGSASLSYVYSIGYSLADVSALALAAQDSLAPASVVISSPASGTVVGTPTATLSGIASAGSGIKSLLVAGQPVPVGPGGAWSAQVSLVPGSNTITALATDGAGATVQAQVTVLFQPPAVTSSSPSPPAPAPPPVGGCKVPRIKGMKLRAAERAIRRAHCKVGKIKRVKSQKVKPGRVTGSAPRAGRWLTAGAKVELFVAKGR
jgi:hypothetical protein